MSLYTQFAEIPVPLSAQFISPHSTNDVTQTGRTLTGRCRCGTDSRAGNIQRERACQEHEADHVQVDSVQSHVEAPDHAVTRHRYRRTNHVTLWA